MNDRNLSAYLAEAIRLALIRGHRPRKRLAGHIPPEILDAGLCECRPNQNLCQRAILENAFALYHKVHPEADPVF